MNETFRKICAIILLWVTALSYIIALIITVDWTSSYQVCCIVEALCLFIVAYNCGVLFACSDPIVSELVKSPDDQSTIEG